MFRFLRSAMVTIAVSITSGVFAVPSAAYAADTTTSLSAASMAAELRAASTTSTAAAKSGWAATLRFASPDRSASGRYVVDSARGVVFNQTHFTGGTAVDYAVAGKGVYTYTDDPTTLTAVKMMGRPSVRYVFTSKTLNLDAYIRENLLSPAALLTKDVNHAGTRTSHGDGSRRYAFKNRDNVSATIRIDPAGVLTSTKRTGLDVKMTLVYTYGAQHVTLPAASATIDSKTLATAVAYQRMPTSLKNVADQAAAHTLSAANGQIVTIASLRATVRRDAAAYNSAAGVTMMEVHDVSGGARLSATNPWTHRTASYTVKASGTKVLVAQG